MHKVTVVGALDVTEKATGGQTVKTRELLCLLEQHIGNKEVKYVDTFGWKKNPFGLFFRYLWLSSYSKNIIMLPAHKGLQVFSRLLYISKKLFGARIYYDVIGGWLYDKVKDNGGLSHILKKYDGIWVETSSMKLSLEKIGFNNVFVVNNFKALRPIEISTKISFNFPRKLCTFSRVLKEKGIEDAIDVVTRINKERGTIWCTLDIYGKVDHGYQDSFDELRSRFPQYVAYKGVIDADQSVEILKYYYLLLFPTHYQTEGIPGSIIDAYFAGLPVVSSRWENFKDVIDEGCTGFGFEMNNNDDFYHLLGKLLDDSTLIQECKKKCIEKSKEYTPEYVYSQVIQSGFSQK